MIETGGNLGLPLRAVHMASDQRILLITRNLPPLVGGMERLNWHLADEMSQRAAVRIIGPKGSAGHAPRDVAVSEVPLTPLWKFLSSAQWQAVREARRWKPTVVVAGSGLTAPLALLAARASGARSVVYAHGLDLTVDHRIYKKLWLPALRRMDRVIANSGPTRKLAQEIGIDVARIGVVHPGVHMPSVFPDSDAITRFRAINDFGDRPLLLSVGRLSERKGLREFVTKALPRIVSSRPDALLVVVGDAPSQALHAKAQTRDSIQAAADAAGVGGNLRFMGVITDYAELGVLYRVADVHVFPVRELAGDPEGFGMVAVEAAAHGLPTVAFATGGVIDAVAEGQSGRLVKPGDYAAFADAALEVLANRNGFAAASAAFAQRFAWSEFGAHLARQLES